MAGYTQEQSSLPWLNQIIGILEHNNVTIFDVLVQVLRFGHIAQNLHSSWATLQVSVGDIANLQLEQEEGIIRNWVAGVTINTYQNEIVHLVEVQQGLHFRANHATLEQLKSFDLAELGTKMKSIAPLTWQMLAALLDSNDLQHGEVDEEDMDSDSTESSGKDDSIWNDFDDLDKMDFGNIQDEVSDENETFSVASMDVEEQNMLWESSSQFSMDVDVDMVPADLSSVAHNSGNNEEPKRQRHRKQDLLKRHRALLLTVSENILRSQALLTYMVRNKL